MFIDPVCLRINHTILRKFKASTARFTVQPVNTRRAIRRGSDLGQQACDAFCHTPRLQI